MSWGPAGIHAEMAQRQLRTAEPAPAIQLLSLRRISAYGVSPLLMFPGMHAQVAMRQQRPSGAAPPGFESQGADRPNAPVPPPGFESKAPLLSSPGIPRGSNGFPKTSPAKVFHLSFTELLYPHPRVCSLTFLTPPMAC